jgi:hypothetical protein
VGVFADSITIVQSEWGWLITTLVFLYQLFWPLWETKLQNITHRLEAKIDNVRERQLHQIQVIRALARQNDGIDHDTVDEYLVENGVEVDDFIEEESASNTYCADD